MDSVPLSKEHQRIYEKVKRQIAIESLDDADAYEESLENVRKAWDKMLSAMYQVLESWPQEQEAKDYPQHVPSFDELYSAFLDVEFPDDRSQ